MSTAQRVGRAARRVVTLVFVAGVGYGLVTGDPSHAFPVVVPAAVVLTLLRLVPGAGSTGGSSYDGSASSSSLWSTGSDAGSGGWSGGDSGGGSSGDSGGSSGGGDSSGGGGSW